MICISSSLIVADSMGVKISINGNEKQFNIDRYYRSIWKDTIVYPYIFLNASCGTECLTKFILNFNTGDSFEYLFFIDIDYKQKIIANQGGKEVISDVNIINFSGDTLKIFDVGVLLTYWDSTVISKGINGRAFEFIPTYLDTVDGIPFKKVGEVVRLEF